MSVSVGGVGSQPVQHSLEAMSSGKRLNKAADDPAGMAVAEGLSALVRSDEAAMRNVNDGLSVAQVTSGATAGVADSVSRMRELAVAASSGTLSDSGRAAIQREVTQLVEDVDRIAASTEFNGLQLADGSAGSVEVAVGAGEGADSRFAIPTTDLRSEALGIDAASVDLSTAEGARAALSAFDDALDQLNSAQSELGASENRLESSLHNLMTEREATTAAYSRIADTDYGAEATALATAELKADLEVAVQSHTTLNEGAVLKLLG